MATRISNSVNLKNNDTYDILLFGFPEGYPTSKLTFEFGETPRRISGLEKVVQTFVKCLLTPKGSDPIYPSFGTYFQDFFMYSNVGTYDPAEAKSAIAGCIDEAQEQAKYILNSSKYSKEAQLDTVELISVTQGSEDTYIRMRILSKAGQYAPIQLPFTSSGITINE